MALKDYIRGSNGDGEAVRAIVTEDRGIGNLALVVDSVLNWPAKFIATSGEVDTDGTLIPETVCVFRGYLDGSIIMIESFSPGYLDLGHTENQVVLLKPTTDWADTVAESLADSGASVTIAATPPTGAQPGDLWGDTSATGLQSIITAVGSALMPIGQSIITTNSANPATYYGFGTWVEDVKGRTIVGVDASQTEFNTLGKTGGHKLMQAHKHRLRVDTSTGDGGWLPNGSTNINAINSGSTAGLGTNTGRFTDRSGTTWVTPAVMETTGGGDSENLQPYITKYIWTRTA